MSHSVEHTDCENLSIEAFCRELGIRIPALRILPGEDIPQPYQSLLVHEDDMTPTLESFHQCTLRLRVIDRREDEAALYRQVLLINRSDQRPKVYGAIRIAFAPLSTEATKLVQACDIPLGTILADCAIEHHSEPAAYFAVESDQTIRSILGLTEQYTLYGRHNRIYGNHRQLLAQVIEILPPQEEMTGSKAV